MHREHKSFLQEGNCRAYQEMCVPLMSAIPNMLKCEINEVEFNFRVYKFIMCSSFVLPFYMAGWSWQTYFVRRAAFEFWFNETLTPCHITPLISTCSNEKEMLLTIEIFTTGNVHSCLPVGGLWGFPQTGLQTSSQQRAHRSSAVAPEQFPFFWGDFSLY